MSSGRPHVHPSRITHVDLLPWRLRRGWGCLRLPIHSLDSKHVLPNLIRCSRQSLLITLVDQSWMHAASCLACNDRRTCPPQLAARVDYRRQGFRPRQTQRLRKRGYSLVSHLGTATGSRHGAWVAAESCSRQGCSLHGCMQPCMHACVRTAMKGSSLNESMSQWEWEAWWLQVCALSMRAGES